MADQSSDRGRGGGWVAGQLVIGGIALALGFVGPGWPDGAGAALRVAGLTVAAVGATMLAAGGAFLGRSLTPFPRPKGGGDLREHGIYAVVRHPMYGGVILMAIGWGLATTPSALAAGLGLGMLLELKSRREEVWLVGRYPAYTAYRLRVRWKFVPGVR